MDKGIRRRRRRKEGTGRFNLGILRQTDNRWGVLGAVGRLAQPPRVGLTRGVGQQRSSENFSLT